jgi:uncharacterized protein YuzE
MTREPYLEITYRHGKALGAYLYLPGVGGHKVSRSQKAGPGLVVDYSADGQPVGIEIASPATVSGDQINALLARLNLKVLDEEELSPLLVG